MNAPIRLTPTVGTQLWQQVGVSLPDGADTEEVLARARFYDVIERPLTLDGQSIPDRKALVRADTGSYLSTVGKKYQPVQFADVFRTVVEAGQGFQVSFRAAGTFGPNGVRAWMLAELPAPIRVNGDDSPMRKFLLAVAGHDGQTAVLLKNTALRIWCSNSIGAALRSLGGLWRIHHTPSALQRLDEVARGFGQMEASFSRLAVLANRLAVTRFTADQMSAVARAVLPVADDGLDHSRALDERRKMEALFETGVGITPSIRGTAWAAVNATSEYFDHHRAVRAAGPEVAARRRLESSWIGTAASKKEAALAAITEAVGIQLDA